MLHRPLNGVRVMVVEDEYLLADDILQALVAAGAAVIGPVPSVGEAAAILDDGPAFDLAILDVNLRGELVYPIADALVDRGIGFAFATGYDRAALPVRFAKTLAIDKPFTGAQVTAALAPLVPATAAAPEPSEPQTA